jgi:hypothetical protein
MPVSGAAARKLSGGRWGWGGRSGGAGERGRGGRGKSDSHSQQPSTPQSIRPEHLDFTEKRAILTRNRREGLPMNTISLTPAAAGHAPVGSPPAPGQQWPDLSSPVGADATFRSAAQGRGWLRVRERCAAASVQRSFFWRDWRYTSTVRCPASTYSQLGTPSESIPLAKSIFIRLKQCRYTPIVFSIS